MSFVDLFKALATLLVINSHCDELLPIPALATGGSIGDSLFFAVSGYTLFRSVDKKAFEYFKARFIRLYPAIVIATIIVMAVSMALPEYPLICSFTNITLGGLFQSFIFPTNYHFLSVLIVLYIVYYACLHSAGTSAQKPLGGGKTRNIIIALAVQSCAYVVWYAFFLNTSKWSIETEPFKFMYWAMAFFIGGLCRGIQDRIEGIKANNSVFGFGAILLFLFFYIVKLLLSKYSLMEYQFVIHILEIAFLFTALIWAIRADSRLKRYEGKKSWRVVKFLSSITLENYLLMDIVIAVLYYGKVAFPISWILAFAITFVGAFLLHKTVSAFFGRRQNNISNTNNNR